MRYDIAIVPNKPINKREISENILPGDEISMILKLMNSIDKKVESVSVRAFKESTQPIEFLEKSDYVGTLNSKDMGEAVIKFDIKKNAEPKKYIIDLEIRSIYNQEVFVQSEKVSIDVLSPEKKFDKNIITYILSAVILILFLVIIFISRKNAK
jgi:Fe2+ transport system protein B